MVNTQDYKPSSTDYLSVDTVKNSNTKIATILPGSGWNEFNNTDPETGEKKVVEKPFITIELDGETYEWTLNMTTNERLVEDFGSAETDDWVGNQVKLLVDKRGTQEFVTATGMPVTSVENV